MKRFCGRLLLGISLLLGNSLVQADEIECGSLSNGFGPYDFRHQFGEPKRLVESAHFPPYVESLLRGRTADAVGGDIDYTLRAFPNHHRALLSMMNLATREHTRKPPGSRFTIECWLDRAERFAPDDGMVKVLWATWMIKQGNKKEAEEKLKAGVALAPESNANFDYSVGLAYFDLRRYDLSLAAAHRAYQAGFPLPGLKQKLKKAGQWRDAPPLPPPSPEPDAASGSSAAVTTPERLAQ
ncbi:hypothetical protein [Chitinimonas sp. BJB300]|uniref:hypothetical protein n=1 Tax=Chitinimonas sp. BJB300 TaxID=1559339 RepID=UPI000C11BDE9|nr:hypothetical protein [Chitinimonas sp. BJB300]PHV13342.1 hypothetical protein CSQ89_00870 [Chitinimonas sp. BJB300]TSJ85259.1 hypothetical protein FG002_017755 [Chitinimonas sp. BJB300]